jgi:hypothetical protein
MCCPGWPQILGQVIFLPRPPKCWDVFKDSARNILISSNAHWHMLAQDIKLIQANAKM